jgi:hypothetical protein
MEETITELELSRKLGIPRNTLISHRKNLKRGPDFKKDGRSIVYTNQGVESIIKLVGITKPTENKKPLTEPIERQNEEILTFIQGNFPNRAIIRAKRQNGDLVMVRVKSSQNFTLKDHTGKPMTFPAVYEGGIWVIKRPCPRWRGKW